ncbi:MAG: [LysW]-aminoadipate/[LysW]-glutamate kinase [Nitrososphaerota archaeon]|nr:[LysW]-aminoadipate/[LysW]-glutamate kinase [Candidatus Calditenuaceae archaeon]MDW8073562.1 [LysW]-aminoadipate/[LysW]-glutamate kinase [Nitrososphaerota archaeon]
MVIVVKAGGRALQSNMENIAKSLAGLLDQSVVFVHGGGDVVTEYSKRLGITPTIVTSPSGIRSRYTDERELEVYVMTMAGKVNKELVSAVQRYGGKAVGLSGVDGALLLAERKKRIIIVDERGRNRVIPGGYTGSIRSVNTTLLMRILEAGYLPVVAPLALGTEGEILNVDGDQAASWVARSIPAEMLVFLSDVDGVMVGGKVVERLTPSEALELAKNIGPGMNRKLVLAGEAVNAGVRKALITSGLGEDPLSRIKTGQGTVVQV